MPKPKMDKASEDMGTAREPEKVKEKQKEEKEANETTAGPPSVNESMMNERLERRKEVIKKRKIRGTRRKLRNERSGDVLHLEEEIDVEWQEKDIDAETPQENWLDELLKSDKDSGSTNMIKEAREPEPTLIDYFFKGINAIVSILLGLPDWVQNRNYRLA